MNSSTQPDNTRPDISDIEERIANLKSWPIANEGKDGLADMVREMAATITCMQDQKRYTDEAMSYIIREVEWVRIFPSQACGMIKAVASAVKDGKPIPLPKP